MGTSSWVPYSHCMQALLPMVHSRNLNESYSDPQRSAAHPGSIWRHLGVPVTCKFDNLFQMHMYVNYKQTQIHLSTTNAIKGPFSTSTSSTSESRGSGGNSSTSSANRGSVPSQAIRRPGRIRNSKIEFVSFLDKLYFYVHTYIHTYIFIYKYIIQYFLILIESECNDKS